MADKRRVEPKSKEYVRETLDIVQNTEDDEAALDFLKNALDDDYPDLDLGSMDLHEAIKVLDPDKEKTKSKQVIEDLNSSLISFIDSQNKNKDKEKKKTNKKSRRRKRKKR